MEVKPKLILAVFLAPLTKDIYSIYVYIPIINFMLVILKTVEIGIASIVVPNPTSRFKNIRIVEIVILFPRVATVAL
jgi:hypothetical protein